MSAWFCIDRFEYLTLLHNCLSLESIKYASIHSSSFTFTDFFAIMTISASCLSFGFLPPFFVFHNSVKGNDKTSIILITYISSPSQSFQASNPHNLTISISYYDSEHIDLIQLHNNFLVQSHPFYSGAVTHCPALILVLSLRSKY